MTKQNKAVTDAAEIEGSSIKVLKVEEGEEGQAQVAIHADNQEQYEKLTDHAKERVRTFFGELIEGTSRSQLSFLEKSTLMASELPETVGSPMDRYVLAARALKLPSEETTQATLGAIAPQDGVELLLATQMAAVHNATLEAARRAGNCDYVEELKYHEGALNRLTRTFAAQTEALRKHRGKGTQTVRHVHVNEGGQAIVADTVSTTHVAKGEG